MRGLTLGVLALLIGCATFPDSASPQSPTPLAYLVFGTAKSTVRDTLARHYRTLDRSPTAHEYGFCGVNVPDQDGNPHIVAVMFPADSGSGPNFVVFHCPPGAMRGHVHPPGFCEESTTQPGVADLTRCSFNHPYSNQCEPSPKDVGIAAREGVSMVQCDEHAIVFFMAIPGDPALGQIRPPVIPSLLPLGHPR
jgi:hypothetical protein